MKLNIWAVIFWIFLLISNLYLLGQDTPLHNAVQQNHVDVVFCVNIFINKNLEIIYFILLSSAYQKQSEYFGL